MIVRWQMIVVKLFCMHLSITLIINIESESHKSVFLQL